MCEGYGCSEEGKGENVGLMKGSLVFSYLERVYVVKSLGAGSKTVVFGVTTKKLSPFHVLSNPYITNK